MVAVAVDGDRRGSVHKGPERTFRQTGPLGGGPRAGCAGFPVASSLTAIKDIMTLLRLSLTHSGTLSVQKDW